MTVLSRLTLDAVQAEATAAHAKHGVNTALNPVMSWGMKLAILMEEVGEVAHEYTYDTGKSQGELRDAVVKELVQVAAVALTWVESLEGQRL